MAIMVGTVGMVGKVDGKYARYVGGVATIGTVGIMGKLDMVGTTRDSMYGTKAAVWTVPHLGSFSYGCQISLAATLRSWRWSPTPIPSDTLRTWKWSPTPDIIIYKYIHTYIQIYICFARSPLEADLSKKLRSLAP